MQTPYALHPSHPLLLYLDYDGPLHPWPVYQTPTGLELRAPGKLFMHVNVLLRALAPYPHVRVILSTSWVITQGFETACSYLPGSLQQRVIGATWEPALEEFDVLTWRRLSRYEQIQRHAERHAVSNWLALDDDNSCWPDHQLDRLVLCHNVLGLGDAQTNSALQLRLRTLDAKTPTSSSPLD